MVGLQSSSTAQVFCFSRDITFARLSFFEELRNTNGCYLVTQFSSNSTNRFILSELSLLAKINKKFIFNVCYYKNLKVQSSPFILWRDLPKAYIFLISNTFHSRKGGD